MKKQFINSIKTGDAVDDIFVLAEKNLAQKKDGNNFLNISLSDKTGDIKGVVWDNVDQISEKISAGDFARVRGNVTEYRGSLQLVIKNIEACSADSIDPADFLPESRLNRNDMFERLLKLTATIETLYLKNLLEAFWNDDEFVSKFKRAPAAKKMHHAYIGGLIEHTLSMTLLADKIATHYKGIDRDLLIASAILHDIGKIREFDYKVKIDYSDEGRLLNHIVIGVQMIEEKLRNIKNFPDEQALLIKHMIVSHHGTREFGSPEPPKTIEAVLLNYIDEIDSKVNGIREFIAREDPNETWTSFHRLLERYFYMGKNKKDLTD
ncbi:MAG: HD domain-containing protein [Proteobacteria bacterium]|nr:HD domain-containing protein [Desulfobacteraceae bacterium]MBU3979837.1 HD domain-containing protein [Pseudomonadota bacterium]MBU4012196.1 HD domain-containing protein [Pseudomonadota bacterium]MBU4067348.1 HD domain-containing protein [Pseudomonadota bacterium]MBU4102037.1 HD domain-containing protein [Pseudomonadota bacterium]